mmetsp:Transcript_80506/g.225907  ORF Transcript_80506/g.225907 Transcript_80506/m.225907 type:complete len:210 (-) Transcript_80506:452-1081(-)
MGARSMASSSKASSSSSFSLWFQKDAFLLTRAPSVTTSKAWDAATCSLAILTLLGDWEEAGLPPSLSDLSSSLPALLGARLLLGVSLPPLPKETSLGALDVLRDWISTRFSWNSLRYSAATASTLMSHTRVALESTGSTSPVDFLRRFAYFHSILTLLNPCRSRMRSTPHFGLLHVRLVRRKQKTRQQQRMTAKNKTFIAAAKGFAPSP